MAADNLSEDQKPEQKAKEAARPLPNGYRQGVITAISVILGFSLYFARFWALEAAGEWTLASFLASVPVFLSIICLSVALWRSLQVADDNERVYRKTLKWFLRGVVLALAGILAVSVVSTFSSDQVAEARTGWRLASSAASEGRRQQDSPALNHPRLQFDKN